jgi:hypothetical protein
MIGGSIQAEWALFSTANEVVPLGIIIDEIQNSLFIEIIDGFNWKIFIHKMKIQLGSNQ